MTNQTVLGFDFGVQRIGVAVGNTLTRQASPLKIIHDTGNDARFAEIARLLKEWQVSLCVVGIPRHPDGNPHEMTARCTRFANQLQGRLNIAVVQVDERYSSAVLEQKRGVHIDDQAAALILQQYFDENPGHDD